MTVRRPKQTEVLDITKVVESQKTPTAFKRTKFEFNTDRKDSMNANAIDEEEKAEFSRFDKSKTMYSKTRTHHR